jgi:site-specific recombinase XerD
MNLPGRPTLYRLQAPFELEFIARKNSYHGMAKRIETLVEYFGRDKEAGDITRDMVKHYKAWLIEKKKFSEATAKLYCSAGRSFFNWMLLMEVENVTFNPFDPMIQAGPLYRPGQTMYDLVNK